MVDKSSFLFIQAEVGVPRSEFAELADFNFRCWPDFSECNVAAIDFGGTLVLNICENFKDKQIIPDLIDLCGAVGIHLEAVDRLVFEQANLRLTL